MDPSSALYLSFACFMFLFIPGVLVLRLSPLLQAASICGVSGAVSLVAAAALALFVLPDPRALPDLPRPVALVLCARAALEGLVYLALAAGIAARLEVCSLLAALCFSAGALLSLLGLPDAKPEVVVRVVLTIMLWRAWVLLREEEAGRRWIAERREQLETLRASSAPRARFVDPVPGAPTPPVVEAAAEGEPGPAPEIPGPAMACPNCQGRYPPPQARCPGCGVVLYED